MRRTTPPPRMPKIDLAAAAKVIKGYVPGAVIERTHAGLDIHGKPFAAYSQAYREELAKGSEDPRVDLRLTGGLINSVKERGTVITSDSVTVTIAPDTGSSKQMKAVAGRTTKTGKQINGKMRPTGKMGPPHNVVGAWLHDGVPGRMPPRPWLGLTPEEDRELRALIAAVVIKP